MQSVERLMSLLNLLSINKDGLTITEISLTVDLPLSTLHRLLSSLKEHQMIVQENNTKKYLLGTKILTLASSILNNLDIRSISKQYLEKLSKKTGKMVFLSIFEGNKVICIDTVSESKNYNFYVRIGSEMPFSAAISAQVILAYQDEKTIKDIIEGIDYNKYTDNSILTKKELLKKIEIIKQNGIGTCIEEFQDGVHAYAAPVYNFEKNVIASITMLEIKMENDMERFNKQNLLCETAYEISKELGYK